ncbi:MAG: HAMP domain-containing protein [Lachnospiraceae bacterium]|nr:HAMP domain-containing protein [Lachnospiraceae bacterium]
MKNLKIRAKLLVTFLIIIILFCGTVYVSISGLRDNEEKYSEFYKVGYQITNKVMSMRRGLQIIVKDISYITIEDDASKSQKYLEDMEKELALLQENGNWLFANFTDNPELLNSFSDNVQGAVAMQQEVIQTAQTDNAKAQDMLLNEYQPLVEEAVSNLIQISDIASANADRDFNETVAMQQTLISIQFGIAVAVLIITLVLSTYLTSSITRPLRALEKSAKKIEVGDFNIDINYESRDELGSLAKTFKNMTSILEDVITDASMVLSEMANGNFDVRTKAEKRYVGSFQNLLASMRKLNRDLSSTLGQINQSADLVASGSGQVSDGAQALAQGATEQASAVEELASTITNISQQIKTTAENAMEAKVQSTTADTEVEECNRQMSDMIVAMEEITRTSNEIGKIIKTIEDIAFQTNILALNAAVEASRAGQAGKGFAVVANEVRSLASKSSIASKDTANLIEHSIEAVAHGTQLVDSTAQSLIKVVDAVRTTSSKVDVIANAAEQQADAIEQVSVGVDQISSVVQTNSATSEQSAAASQELSSQAEMLKRLVAKFILRAEYASGATSSRNNYGNSRSGITQINLD